MSNPKQIAKELLAQADIQINGSRPWDLQVHNEDVFARTMREGSLGFGESYMDGWWDVEQLDEFFSRILGARLEQKVQPSFKMLMTYLGVKLFNPQTKSRAKQVGEQHYDVGDDLYERMLDKRMTYTCGYWKDADNLDDAQEAKLDLVCRKIGLKEGDKVLDIGCGWGSFAIYAAQKYGAHVVGVTISKNQVETGMERAQGLPVELRFQDYRDVTEKFDHVVSLGMFEHVGERNYREYFEVVNRVLKNNGSFLLHTIGGLKSVSTTDPWIAKYIFPNSMLPSAAQITKAVEGLFAIEDWHNFGADYDHTLMAWMTNVDEAWKELVAQNPNYTDRFYRMWKFYLMSCAGSFRCRKNQLWQIVLHKTGVPGGYTSVR